MGVTGDGTTAPEDTAPGDGRAAVTRRPVAENHSTRGGSSARIDPMFRYAFHLAASAVADAPKAAVPAVLAAVDGARS
ncbi:hypothetical protein GCM10017779_36420 [Streptomyces capillispiralis]|nr:hypothetical protein GCM10017779_36420 [Streptomyces capillispiralis]